MSSFLVEAFEKAFSREDVTLPTKAYMAISTAIPAVNECYICRRLERGSNGDIAFVRVTTSLTLEVKQMAENIFLVVTRNSLYITRVVPLPVGSIHFAVIKSPPQIGEQVHCQKLVVDGYTPMFVGVHTTAVQQLFCILGTYIMHTRNSIYVCFPA